MFQYYILVYFSQWKTEEEEKTKKIEERRLRSTTRGRQSPRGQGKSRGPRSNVKDMEVTTLNEGEKSNEEIDNEIEIEACGDASEVKCSTDNVEDKQQVEIIDE